MTISAVLFGLMAVVLRLAMVQVSAFEGAFFRALFGLIFALPLLLKTGLGVLRTRHVGLYVLRGTSGTLSMLGSFWALAHLPLATAVSISYSTPLFVTIGAVLVLGEVVRARRWSAVAIGFIGVLIIMRPGANADPINHRTFDMLVALFGAAAASVSYIAIKYLSRTESPDAVVIYMSAIMTVLSFPVALRDWSWPNAMGWLWLVLTGLIATVAQLCMTRAYQRGEVSALIPINFIQLPVVVVGAWFVFGQRIDATTIAGAIIIVASNIYIARREAKLKRGSLQTETRI